ncbi:MAG: ABC transporter permease [Nitrososphaerales archaeon]
MESSKEAKVSKEESRFRSSLRLIRKNKEATIGAIVVAVFIVTAIVVEIAELLNIQITPYQPLQLSVGPPLASPSWAHLFGTDLLGRDMFSRIIASSPNDVAVGLVVVGVAIAIGTIIGAVAAFKGGLLDELLMRFTDIIFALPALVIAMVIAVALGPGLTNMMFAMMIIWWPPYARVARGEALKIKHQNYIEAARFSGMRTGKTIVKHVIPNFFTIMIIYATLDIGTVILTYAGLSYLGLSVKPPTPDWGEMISEFQDYLITAPWLPILPGLVIAIEVIGFSLLGDGIRDALGFQ